MAASLTTTNRHLTSLTVKKGGDSAERNPPIEAFWVLRLHLKELLAVSLRD